MNAFSSSKYWGLQVWYSQNNSESQSLADMIQSQNRATLQPDNNRLTKNAGESIYLLKMATCPAVLVECGFLSNVEEAKKFEGYEYRTQVASVICSSIVSFLSE